MKLVALVLMLTAATPAAPVFRTVPVVIETSSPVAAWQVEITGAEVLGIEGGVSPFGEPPYYDAEALTGGRLILAAFSTSGALPAGRHVVATLHVRETGEPSYRIVVTAAAGPSGARLEPRAYLERIP